MRACAPARFPGVLAVLAVLTLAAPARAEGAHTLSATCTAVRLLDQPAVAGHAVSGGTPRPVSTEVTCSVDLRDGGPVVRRTSPGPVAVAAATNGESAGPLEPYVCVRASAFWSDGFTFETSRCGRGSASVEETR